MYRKCNEFWLTRWYVDKISRAFEVLYPGEQLTIAKKTMQTAFILWTCSLAAILLFSFNMPSLYTIATGAFLIVIIHYEVVNGVIKSMEIRLLKQFEKFLSDIRHSYYVNHMVEESVADASEYCGYEMKIHATKLLDILTSEDVEEEIQKYNDTVPNKFIRLFMALCLTVIDYGDQVVNGESLFLNNIKTLKNDIHIELLKLSDTKFRFSGLVLIAVVPVFFLHSIKKWSLSNLPELESFYSGSKGTFLAVFIYVLTIISYIMLNELKEVQSVVPKEHYILSRLIEFPWINGSLNNYIEKHYGKILQVKEQLKKTGDNISAKQFLLKRILYGLITFLTSCIAFISLHIKNHTGYLLWQEVLLSCLFAYLAYWLPYWLLLYRRKIMQMNMEDEVIQFQSIIMMLMNIDRMSVLSILELMESFAVIFRDSIQDCINDYNAGDMEALEDMKDKEAFEPFKRLVDNFLISDKIGIEKAFDEITSDHLYYQDKRKQENEINLSKKVVIGKLIAYVPIIVTIGLYLIVPFVMESLNQLLNYTEDMKLL